MHPLIDAVVLTLAMARDALWPLLLGLLLSAAVQAVVPTDGVRRLLGRDDGRAVAVATAAGAASSSCTYAAVAVARTLLARGAALGPTLAFLVASTNLVIELGLVLILLLGWRFAAAEWVGALVLVGIVAVLGRTVVPARRVETARAHATDATGHQHATGVVPGDTLADRLRHPALPMAVARAFATDVGMLWRDVALGFVIAGAIGAWVPHDWWATVFGGGAVASALLGPLVAFLSFVCSIGNVPLAAILWRDGVGFGGVLAFLYADLLVIPVLDSYRRAFGLPFAAILALLLYATIVPAALLTDGVFHAVGLAPHAHAARLSGGGNVLSIGLDVVFAAVAVGLLVAARRDPGEHAHHHG